MSVPCGGRGGGGVVGVTVPGGPAEEAGAFGDPAAGVGADLLVDEVFEEGAVVLEELSVGGVGGEVVCFVRVFGAVVQNDVVVREQGVGGGGPVGFEGEK